MSEGLPDEARHALRRRPRDVLTVDPHNEIIHHQSCFSSWRVCITTGHSPSVPFTCIAGIDACLVSYTELPPGLQPLGRYDLLSVSLPQYHTS